MKRIKKIGIIGGGAAGFFAALNSAEKNPEYEHIIFEATRRPLTKVKISGGGRCNVTHHCFDPLKLSLNYPRGSRELIGAFKRFSPKETVEWFRKKGLLLKIEEDGRMFPASNKSSSVIECFMSEAKRLGVSCQLGKKVTKITKKNDQFELNIHQDDLPFCVDFLILATGSSPYGHHLAGELGHSITEIVPSLFTFKIKDPLLEGMMGLSFKKLALKLTVSVKNREKTWQEKADVLITHWGLSGPAVLRLSAFAAKELFHSNYQANLQINWLGNESFDLVVVSLNQYKQDHPRQSIGGSPLFSLSKRFWQRLLKIAKISPEENWAEIPKISLRTLAQNLSQTQFKVSGKGVFKEEFVSCGGVSLKEVHFQKMESKICPGLFFAGEILDIDGLTGGFNFQNAWTTAWLVAEAISCGKQVPR